MSSSISIQIAKVFTLILLTLTEIPVSNLAAEKPIKSSTNTQYRKISIQGNVEAIMVQRESRWLIIY